MQLSDGRRYLASSIVHVSVIMLFRYILIRPHVDAISGRQQVTMCDSKSQPANALITAQDHGTILAMVAWFLACLVALCTAVRLIARHRLPHLRQFPLSDDAIIVAASLCTVVSAVIISTAVDSGLGKRRCLLTSADMEQIQLKVYVSTLLSILAIGISKFSMLLYLFRITEITLQRVGVTAIGVFVSLWTIVVLAGTVFQCEMPKPWEIFEGRCIPLLPFWITAISVDIVTDLLMILLSIGMVWTMRIDHCQRTWAISVFSLRFILVVTSAVRIVYLKRVSYANADPTYDYQHYAIPTQCHSTFAVMLACTLVLKPMVSLLHVKQSQQASRSMVKHAKHWSGSTIRGTPYEPYDAFVNPHITKESLPSIQATMSTTPTSFRYSLDEDILLPDMPAHTKYTHPDIPLPIQYKKVSPIQYKKASPPRPPRPTSAQRPDLSIFTKTTYLKAQPMTRLGSVKNHDTLRAWENVGSLRARGLA
ncbi:hypothetical protein EJ02DRAFT_129282 [Clathrospora elynae]|uniref:Rhodopsin domain-containing protein n=1 Tax=Clathrospora elynae TaxID=706981 RepID=A0A6A5STL9_9PLEO|nr:hypothetical protein EJ02DRAFT_129282 [Clathrospora elynae]